MVAVTQAAPQAAAPQAVGAWLDSLAPVYTDADRERFAAAYEMARERVGDARGADGEPLIERALGTAGILAAQRLDPDSLTASLLVGLPVVGRVRADASPRHSAPTSRRSSRASRGWTRCRRGRRRRRAAARAQAENLRKMLLAMVEDIRVVLIKLAERTQALRYLDHRRRGRRRTRRAR